MARGASLRKRLHTVILAGGAGERFWPVSRRRLPKPFLALAGTQPLLEETQRRALRYTDRERVWVVCGREHAGPVRKVTGLPASQVIVEPRRRNTAMATAAASLHIQAQDPDAVVAILPSDHRIPDERAFARAIRRCARAADAEGALITLGVRPGWAETGYGYIQVGKAVGAPHAGLHRARRFVEKPDGAKARRYLRQGGYLWNAGIFVWSVGSFLGELECTAPDVHRALAPLRARPAGRGFKAALERAYRRAPSHPVDQAVFEKSRRVWTLPVDFHWSDVGTWGSLAAELGVGERVNRVVNGETLLDDAHGNLVWANGRFVALLGVEGLAVIDAGDALLVAKLDRSAEVRRLVDRLGAAGRSDLL